ncbi:hypothetical protein FOZ60_016226 [Perkinsus olseni]|uniref:Uncharacterized protein n=1 Tax=Perkinsus olseni TaxID=32597 RepID=A0A7J6P5I8_PEROL|nr:hypothetical protein FOZ60_016226 [Perkinsus olseni]
MVATTALKRVSYAHIGESISLTYEVINSNTSTALLIWADAPYERAVLVFNGPLLPKDGPVRTLDFSNTDGGVQTVYSKIRRIHAEADIQSSDLTSFPALGEFENKYYDFTLKYNFYTTTLDDNVRVTMTLICENSATGNPFSICSSFSTAIKEGSDHVHKVIDLPLNDRQRSLEVKTLDDSFHKNCRPPLRRRKLGFQLIPDIYSTFFRGGGSNKQ